MTSPFTIPEPSSRSESDADVAALRVPFVVRVAAALQAVSGLYLLVSAIQLLISVRFFGELVLLQILNWVFVVVGLAQLFGAAQVVRLRAPYGWVASVLAALVALLSTVWVATNVYFMIFSCMQVGTVLFAWCAAILAPFTLKPIARASAARRALAKDGLELGL